MFFILLLGEWVIFSVLSCHSENLKQQTSVIVRLQLSFIWQAKENTSLKCEGRPAQKTQREEGGSILAPFFLYVFSPPPRAYPMQIGLAKKRVCLFHLKFSLQSMDFLLFHFCRLFPFFVF